MMIRFSKFLTLENAGNCLVFVASAVAIGLSSPFLTWCVSTRIKVYGFSVALLIHRLVAKIANELGLFAGDMLPPANDNVNVAWVHFHHVAFALKLLGCD